jgi:hypothetical protein
MTEGQRASPRAAPSRVAEDVTVSDETHTWRQAQGGALDGSANAPAGLHPYAAYWIVDPGVAKQSQDWIYAGPAPRRP